jgi:hypothetical protein
MTKKSVTITVSPSGKVTIDAAGFKGKSCSSATAEIELVLGGHGASKKKPEYYAPDSTGAAINQRKL